MRRLFAFTLLIYPAFSWVLETTHQQVIVGLTNNVTLECRYDNKDNGQPRMAVVLGIMLRRFLGSDKWSHEAKVHTGDQNANLGKGVGPGVSAIGRAEKVHNSFLSMTWSMSSSNMIGRYVCAIDGYSDDDTLVQVITNPVYILESKLSLEDLLSMIVDMKKQTEKVSKRTEELTQKAHEDLVTLRRDVGSEIVKVKQEFQNETSKLREGFLKDKLTKIVAARVQENWYEIRKWPGGQYAILNSKAGCPNSTTSVWKAGYLKFPSESKQNSEMPDAVSQPNHFAQPVLERNSTSNSVYIRTCKRATKSYGPAWPKGSYCIHRVGNTCPAGFEEASFDLDDEDDPKFKPYFVDTPDIQMVSNNQGVRFFFCCRNDDDPSTPIILPVDAPFYLYRYKGICQSVQGANVSQEWLRIHTEDDNNGDKYLTALFPDSTLKPFRIFLCFYTPFI